MNLLTLVCALALCLASFAMADEDLDKPAEPRDLVALVALGGRWHVGKDAEGESCYYYRDGEALVDLFSYHRRDSNKDGIENVRISHDEKFLIVRSQGFPNHPTALFPNSQNPNSIRVQDFTFRLPLKPVLADTITRLPMGPVGMALNGVVFFNPFEAGGMNAIEGYSEVWLDSCCGHPEQRGVYHYHKFPTCLKSPFPDDGERHSPIIGFAFDGFPIYGPYERADVMAKDLTGDEALDVCNGHHDPLRGYHYHVTPDKFPYVLGGYAGKPEPSNNRALARQPEGEIKNNATGESRLGAAVLAVRPGSGARGQAHNVTVELAKQDHRGRSMPDAAPTWAQVGPYEASEIRREGDSVTIRIDVPADASAGSLLDLHLEFDLPDRPIQVFKRNNVFRVLP